MAMSRDALDAVPVVLDLGAVVADRLSSSAIARGGICGTRTKAWTAPALVVGVSGARKSDGVHVMNANPDNITGSCLLAELRDFVHLTKARCSSM
jgi:hypothetical protein